MTNQTLGAHRSILVEFTNADDLGRTVRHLRTLNIGVLETFTPYPIMQQDVASARPLRWLGPLVFGAGLLGAVLAYLVQWYANVWNYPQNAGGRPPHAAPAFIISAFEGAILLAALTAFAAFFIASRLPRLWHPFDEVAEFSRSADDRFWLTVAGTESEVQRAAAAVAAFKPECTVHISGE